MEFMQELEKHHLLKNSGNVLNLGCYQGWFSKSFAELGYSVDAVDYKDQLTERAPNIHFHLSKIETFIPTKIYDIIFARNVMFFTQDPIKTTG